ncbi:uncharacterized protein LOC113147095 [Cyclospora cayetanensis]|uniref:Uncharacterized protein LOC113147095 n=1 Tax=Cyclospora cayetanensis TaxID=88456 RepID=A0A6P6RXU7_9EIME|nr:uncharacterized protein LOC113147095 [Cyclospora cayetanensis]
MLQEILMALAGYPGDLFVRVDGEAFLRKEEEGHTETEAGSRGPCLWESHGAYGGGFRVNPSLSGFSQSEVEALERVVAPGYDLLLVKDFIKAAENTGTFPPPASTGCPPFNGSLEWHSGSLAAVPASQAAAETSPPVAGGLYLAALARASRELTDEYLSFLIAAEDAALQQQATLLSAISLALGDQPQRMRTLRYILSQVCAMSLAAAGAGGPLPCGALLDMLWRGRSSGDPVAREVSVRGAPLCCFSSGGAPLGAPAAAATAAAAAAGVVLFIGRTTRVLSRGGRWGERQRQKLAPIARQLREAFNHPSSPAAVILPCLKALRAVVSSSSARPHKRVDATVAEAPAQRSFSYSFLDSPFEAASFAPAMGSVGGRRPSFPQP